VKKISITVRSNKIEMTLGEKSEKKNFKLEDKHDLSRRFLMFLDKQNFCDKKENNCLFVRGSRLGDETSLQRTKSQPIGKGKGEVVLHCIGKETTTWRIVFVTLQVLAWGSGYSFKTAYEIPS